MEGALCVIGEWLAPVLLLLLIEFLMGARYWLLGLAIGVFFLQGLLQMGIRGVTVSDVRGFGAQGGSTERHEGSEFAEDTFIDKVKMEIVVTKDQVEAVVDKIIEKARTGEIGDGKIFLIPVSDVIRIRTGERGEQAERMLGGLADKLSSAIPIS
uniref:Nitrogen regulatory protein P-II n=1 Tax=Oryza brachyantha TaxID=4533 RepID=J3M3Q0_ORYBR